MVSTVRVLVTFTKFEELPKVDEFESAPSSPTSADFENASEEASSSTSSWFQWIRTPSQSSSSAGENYSKAHDLFTIPSEYKWVTIDSKIEKNKKKDTTKSK